MQTSDFYREVRGVEDPSSCGHGSSLTNIWALHGLLVGWYIRLNQDNPLFHFRKSFLTRYIPQFNEAETFLRHCKCHVDYFLSKYPFLNTAKHIPWDQDLGNPRLPSHFLIVQTPFKIDSLNATNLSGHIFWGKQTDITSWHDIRPIAPLNYCTRKFLFWNIITLPILPTNLHWDCCFVSS